MKKGTPLQTLELDILRQSDAKTFENLDKMNKCLGKYPKCAEEIKL